MCQEERESLEDRGQEYIVRDKGGMEREARSGRKGRRGRREEEKGGQQQMQHN